MDRTRASRATPAWISRFYEDDVMEEVEDDPYPIYLIPIEGRHVIWGITQKLYGSSHGIASHSCLLLERYLAAHLGTLTMASGSREWRRIKQELKNKILLLVATCVRIVSKVLSANNQVNGVVIKQFLKKVNENYTLKQINDAEVQVYTALRYRIPLWTNTDKAQMLAFDVGMTSAYDCVAVIMDITDYNRVELQEVVRGVASEWSSASSYSDPARMPRIWRAADTSENKIRNMHLAAGAVAATFHITRHSKDNPDPVPRLAFLTRCPEPYIACIRNAIVDLLLRDPLSDKRTSETFKMSKRPRLS